MRNYFNAMRLTRWPRSLAIFMGTAAFFFIHRDFFQETGWVWFPLQCIFAFLLTWAISTANYIINEVADAPYDIHHPTKKNRPLIKGEIKKSLFLSIGAFLTASSLLIAYVFYTFSFFLALVSLLIAGLLYNIKPFRTKDIPFLDSISESANNPIRFFLGWSAFAPQGLLPPLALLLNWWAFGNFLMIAKRLSEFRLLRKDAGSYRASLRKYTRVSLGLGMSLSVVLFFITYFHFAITFKLPSFLYLSPLVCVYFLLFSKKTLQEKEVMEEPEQLLKQPAFAFYTLSLVIAFFLAFLLDKIGQ